MNRIFGHLLLSFSLCFILCFLNSTTSLAQPKVSHKKIKTGDTIYALLKKYQFNQHQINKVLSKRKAFSYFTLIPGNKYKITRNAALNKLALKLYDNSQDVAYIFWKKGYKSAGTKVEQKKYKIKIKKVSGRIHGSLVASIKRKVKNKHLPYRFMDAYVLDYNLRRQIQRGAKYSLTYEEKYDGKQLIKPGEVLSTSLEINGRMINRHFVRFPGGGSFIDFKRPTSSRPLYSPVNYQQFSSLFKPQRFHPIHKRYIAHSGVDFVMPKGAPIYNVSPGKVVRLGRNRAAGRYVVIRHNNGYESYYNHLYKINKNLKRGDYIKTGYNLGQIGCSGLCTKPHLHFAIKKQGRYVNPIKLIKSYPYNKRHFIANKVALLKR